MGSKFIKASVNSCGSDSCNCGTRAPRKAQATRWTKHTNSGNDNLPSTSRSDWCQMTSKISRLRPDRLSNSSASFPSMYPSSFQSQRLKSAAYFLCSRRDGAQRSCVKGRGDREPLLLAASAAPAVSSSPVWITGNISDASLPPRGEPCSEVSEGARWRCISNSGSILGSCASNSWDGCCPAWACATNRHAAKKRSIVRYPEECGSEISQIL
mmetsp:Transcript_81092/g.235248  ORF Transcript_81092/g.235248 Transcript_81092/m.235248 type:complete len:212 (-) Transcript_81092:68-703(-)